MDNGLACPVGHAAVDRQYNQPDLAVRVLLLQKNMQPTVILGPDPPPSNRFIPAPVRPREIERPRCIGGIDAAVTAFGFLRSLKKAPGSCGLGTGPARAVELPGSKDS